MLGKIRQLKNLYNTLDMETYMLLNADVLKNVNKEKVADYISFFHIFLILNSILSFFYPYKELHQMNIFLQTCNYCDWIHNSYCMTHYGKKDECIVTRAENIFRTLDSRQKEEEYRNNKDINKKPFKKFKPTDGYIKKMVYDRTGFIVPKNWINIIIHSWAGASIYNSYQLI